VGPVAGVEPSAAVTDPDSADAYANTGGGATGSPRSSRQVPGAYHIRPSDPRTKTEGENDACGGTLTHRPRSQAQRPFRRVHSPSIHTADRLGRFGKISTRAGGVAASTSTSALLG